MKNLHPNEALGMLQISIVLIISFLFACQPAAYQTSTDRVDKPRYDEFYLLDSIRVVLNDEGPTSRAQNLILFALPNGNSIEKTMGKQKNEVDDWHYNIQYIDAQIRWLRQHSDESYSVAYLEAPKLSWPAWKRSHSDYGQLITQLFDSLISTYPQARITLSSHSGGGSLINGLIDSRDSIPAWVTRIVFIDSDYGYSTEIGQKLHHWLKQECSNRLVAFAYNDSVALYEGKPFVCATGGTWYRTKMMQSELAVHHPMTKTEGSDLIHFRSEDDQTLIILKKNPLREIFHTEQVRLNGFIHSVLFGTALEGMGYTYFGKQCYDAFIQELTPEFTPQN